MEGDDPAISLQHVFKSFNGKEVLRDMSIDIKRGQSVVIVGGSGHLLGPLVGAMVAILLPEFVALLFLQFGPPFDAGAFASTATASGPRPCRSSLNRHGRARIARRTSRPTARRSPGPPPTSSSTRSPPASFTMGRKASIPTPRTRAPTSCPTASSTAAEAHSPGIAGRDWA